MSELLDRMSRTMIAEQMPPDEHGNLSATALTPLVITIPVNRLPEGLDEMAILAHPSQQELRALIALRGIDETTAQRAIAERPVISIAADSEVPVFSQGLPPGYDTVPEWFSPGAGPRWSYQQHQPGTGTLEAKRWAAYDREAQTLYVWDWALGDQVSVK